MAALAGIFAVLTAVFALFAFVFHEDYARNFGSPALVGYAVGVSTALVAYELLVRRILGRQLERGRTPPAPLRYWNALVETSVPTALILLLGQYASPVLILQGPAVLLYGVFIVLSTLRLDFKLSAFTGLVAAAELIALSFLYRQADAGDGALAMLHAPGFILMKGVIFLVAGAAAGFVAGQLRRRIVRAFGAMEERQRILAAFGQQVSPEIVGELLRQGPEIASRRTFVCVLFLDVRDFTRLAEGKSPEEIVAWQNALFGAAVQIVNRHRGIINQFLGDGFMATFGAPVSGGNDSANAVAAARELLAAARSLSDSGRIPDCRLGIGLHAGEAVTGNIGSAERRQYSVSGNVVILASRIEQLNKRFGSQLLCSGEVLASAGIAAGEAAPLGPVTVKGRDEPLELYRLA